MTWRYRFWEDLSKASLKKNVQEFKNNFLHFPGKKKEGKQKGKKQGKSDTPKRQTASAPKKPAKKNVDVEQPVVKVQPKPQPKPKKKVVVKNKRCCVLLSFLTLLSFALALVTSLAAFCQLEEVIPKEYPWF
uniref:Uncharacterized protein n=1 Tax=Meloidogyne enterolobii TaxID=390850 RepID=A0A6V7VFY5_MELEN|nr:unnamed protein product [Meloidogyne enterolobii]